MTMWVPPPKQAMNDYTSRDKKNYGDTDVAKVAYRSSWKSYLFAVINSTDMIIQIPKQHNLERARLSVLSTSSWAGKKLTRRLFVKEALMLHQALSLFIFG